MRGDSASFHGGYRITPATFEELVQLVGPHIEKQATRFRDPIGAQERLGMILRYVDHAFSSALLGTGPCVQLGAMYHQQPNRV